MTVTETIADVVAEMRARAIWLSPEQKGLSDMLESYANRIENASEKVWDDAWSQGFAEGAQSEESKHERVSIV